MEGKRHRKIHKVIKCAASVTVRIAQISYENVKGNGSCDGDGYKREGLRGVMVKE